MDEEDVVSCQAVSVPVESLPTKWYVVGLHEKVYNFSKRYIRVDDNGCIIESDDMDGPWTECPVANEIWARSNFTIPNRLLCDEKA